MGKVMFAVTEEEVLKALADVKKEVLDPHRVFGPWFDSEEEYEEWAGNDGRNVNEFVIDVLEKLGVLVR
jgi:hypothetical protein